MKSHIPDTTTTPEDVTRLQPHLRSWAALNEMFLLGQLNLDDLLKMIHIECCGLNRKRIKDKLIARYCSTLRNFMKGHYNAQSSQGKGH